VLPFDGLKSADTRPDENANPVAILLSTPKARMSKRFIACSYRIGDEMAHFSRILPVNEIKRIKTLNFAGESGRKIRRVKAGDGTYTTLPGKEALPSALGVQP
jgi:hypothetical protein